MSLASLAQMIETLEAMPALFYSLAFILGALVGSFLNVVIYRLPIMLETAWKADADYIRAILDQGYSLIQPRPEAFEPPESVTNAPEFTLSKPRSHCPACKSPIKPWQNIPIISYLWLRGECAQKHCHQKIPIQYFLVECFTALLSVWVVTVFGVTMNSLMALVLVWCLIPLTMIDFKTQLLPDQIVLPLIWLGLLVNYFHLFASLENAVLGAIFGYMSLWGVFHIFRLLTGKEGMGYGDFKLFAALGAWLGVTALPGIIMIASLVGSVVGLGLIILKKHGRQVPIAFGPYLALGGLISLLMSDWVSIILPISILG